MRRILVSAICAVVLSSVGLAQDTERSSILVTILPDRAVFTVGETVTCQFTVENTGDLRVEGLTLVDNYGSAVPLDKTTLDPREVGRGSRPYTLTALDLPGPFLVDVRASGKDKYNREVVANAYTQIVTPAIALTKEPEPTAAEPGETITYRFTITNLGCTPLSLGNIVDDKLGTIDLTGVSLAVGDSIIRAVEHILPEDPLGYVLNTATVHATAQVGGNAVPVEDTADARVRIKYPLTLEKTAAPAQAYPGQTVQFTITVTNMDDVARAFDLADPLLGLDLNDIPLPPGGVWTKTYPYTVPTGTTQPVVNLVYVTWPRNNGTTGELRAEATVRILQIDTGPGDPPDPRNQPWDVSFAQAKVFDTQVLDGASCRLRVLSGSYAAVTEIPLSGTLYLEVEDPDQDENALLRELVFGAWNRDASSADNALGHKLSEHTYPIWPSTEATGDDRLTPGEGTLALRSISGILPTAKVFLWNVQNGNWEQVSVRETAVSSGIFRSTACIPVSGGAGTLDSSPGDTIIAFYQDPSNHSDIAIAVIKVSEGGAGATPPVGEVRVTFDRPTYVPGERLMITVTDPAYGQAEEIRGAGVLVLKDGQGMTLKSWDVISTVAGEEARFRVTWTLPGNIAPGTIAAYYTDPASTTRTGQATAQVVAPGPTSVTGIAITPNPFSTHTTFSLVSEPVGAQAGKIRISIYDLTGRRVGEIAETDTASVAWDGGSLRNGAYIYVATVETSIPVKRSWEFKGFVYIKR